MGKEEIERIANQYSQDPVTLKLERVAAYVRVSSQEQKLHGLSLDAQKMKLNDYAKKNNMKIVEWYVDEGVSGRKLIRKRPELQRMIIDAEQKKFDRIIFIKLDRFFRSVAEYHECMKRITPVTWSTTEEEYDLTTANGRMLVNMKLTIAEMEADQTGERIDIVNDYKVQTGQPLGNVPFGFTIANDEQTGKKKVIKDIEVSDAIEDVIKYYFMHQSKRKALLYLHAKYHIMISYKTLSLLLVNTMLCGEYRGNPSYCEAYMDRITFDKLQELLQRNIKENTNENRAYLFSGLILCPHCETKLKGGIYNRKLADGGRSQYKKYRCANNKIQHKCEFNKVVNEVTMERMLLKNIEKYLADAKIRSTQITDDSGAVKIPKFDIDAIHEEIDRLNYSWQTGKIRKVEQYEKQYAELIEKLEEAEAEQGEVTIKDFSKIETILHSGWQEIYNHLDAEHKRAFWRSFIKSIEVNWTTEKKEITKVDFF